MFGIRLATWPLRTRARRRGTLFVALAAVLLWHFGGDLARWLGPPRPPEGTVVMDFAPAELADPAGPAAAEWLARYGELGPAALRAALQEEEERYRAEVDAALAARRAAGRYVERPYAAGSQATLPPGVPTEAIAGVIYDPAEARARSVVWTVWLPPEEFSALYRDRDRLAWLRARLEWVKGAAESAGLPAGGGK